MAMGSSLLVARLLEGDTESVDIDNHNVQNLHIAILKRVMETPNCQKHLNALKRWFFQTHIEVYCRSIMKILQT